jgi:hypothetical protein
MTAFLVSLTWICLQTLLSLEGNKMNDEILSQLEQWFKQEVSVLSASVKKTEFF